LTSITTDPTRTVHIFSMMSRNPTPRSISLRDPEPFENPCRRTFNYALRLGAWDSMARSRPAISGTCTMVSISCVPELRRPSHRHVILLRDGLDGRTLLRAAVPGSSPGGGCRDHESALEEQAAKKSGLPLHVFQTRDESTARMKEQLRGHKKIGVTLPSLLRRVPATQRLASKKRTIRRRLRRGHEDPTS